MSEIDTGGLVYGNPFSQNLDGEPSKFDGITRRDWLAGLAMQGIAANPTWTAKLVELADQGGWEDKPDMQKFLVENAYDLADNLIAQGNK